MTPEVKAAKLALDAAIDASTTNQHIGIALGVNLYEHLKDIKSLESKLVDLPPWSWMSLSYRDRFVSEHLTISENGFLIGKLDTELS